MTSRGLRNRNPGNIRRSTTRYKGEVESVDRAFKSFENLAYGYRAMFVLLHTYRLKHGLRTAAEMLRRYAPPVENQTEAYIRSVELISGVPADEPLDTLCAEQMMPLVSAMSRIENGVCASPGDVMRGWEMFADDYSSSSAK
ncbi:MAG: structural protein P5 [Rikenellaceae bacterium]|nr:structural protein P5 [Rikenellaceae bacterium]